MYGKIRPPEKRETEKASESGWRGWWRGAAGGRVDTFEEGSVDAVTPASQWLLRHSSARAHASFRAGLNERTKATEESSSARPRRAVAVSRIDSRVEVAVSAGCPDAACRFPPCAAPRPRR